MLRELLRIVIAIIFILSGFVKAVDPVGFSFKLEEYFAPDVFNIAFLEKLALPIAVFVVALELVLGFLLLLKIKLKPTLQMLIVLCVFFAFLTFYSAYFNKVTDCGCFGDAIKFTPWQSFIKDIILLISLLILWFLYRGNYESKVGKFQKLALAGLSAVAAFFAVTGMINEPLIDFRDYKVGTDLKNEQQKINANPDVYKTFYVLKNDNSGEEVKVNQDDYVLKEEYWKEGTPWKIQSDKTTSEIVKKGYQSEILKFRLADKNGVDFTQEIINAPNAVLLFTYDPNHADPAMLQKVEQKVASEKGAKIFGVTTMPGTYSEIPELTMDGTAIKTIARSNPFVLVLQNGVIIKKVPAKKF